MLIGLIGPIIVGLMHLETSRPQGGTKAYVPTIPNSRRLMSMSSINNFNGKPCRTVAVGPRVYAGTTENKAVVPDILWDGGLGATLWLGRQEWAGVDLWSHALLYFGGQLFRNTLEGKEIVRRIKPLQMTS